MGRTAAGARVRGREELSGDGSKGGAVDGEAGCAGGFARGAKGSGEDESRGVFGVDRYGFPFPPLL